MRVAIDLTSLSYHLTGIERYAIGVTDKMIDIDKNNEYETYPLGLSIRKEVATWQNENDCSFEVFLKYCRCSSTIY